MGRENDGTRIMISYILAGVAGIAATSQSTLTKIAPDCHGRQRIAFFNLIKVGSAFLLFLLLSAFNLSLHGETAIYASVYGISQFFSTLFGFLALASGSLALTSTIVSYSVVIPCLFGIIFLHEEISPQKILGFLLLLITLLLLKKPSDNKKSDKHWAFFVITTFCCNAVSAIVQKLHQTAHPGQFREEFMLYAMGISASLFFAVWLISKKGEKPMLSHTKYAAPSGALMGLNGYLTLYLSSKLPASVLFPTVSVIQTLFNIVFSRVFFKERLTRLQIVGIILGAVSVILIR